MLGKNAQQLLKNGPKLAELLRNSRTSATTLTSAALSLQNSPNANTRSISSNFLRNQAALGARPFSSKVGSSNNTPSIPPKTSSYTIIQQRDHPFIRTFMTALWDCLDIERFMRHVPETPKKDDTLTSFGSMITAVKSYAGFSTQTIETAQPEPAKHRGLLYLNDDIVQYFKQNPTAIETVNTLLAENGYKGKPIAIHTFVGPDAVYASDKIDGTPGPAFTTGWAVKAKFEWPQPNELHPEKLHLAVEVHNSNDLRTLKPVMKNYIKGLADGLQKRNDGAAHRRIS